MKRLMIWSVLMLTGCGAAPLKCQPPQEVKVPVSVGCLGDAPVRPVSAYKVGEYPGGAPAAQAALLDAAAWEGYAVRLEAAQAGCDKKPAKP